MNNKKLLSPITLIALSLLIIAATSYLTFHYFIAKFPSGLSSTALCNISSFFNCEKASSSPLSNLFGIPISLFGLTYGLGLLLYSVKPSDHFLSFFKGLTFINAFGCLVLFLYSLIVLHGLCPFCTLYYILIFILSYIFYKNKEIQIHFHMKSFGILLLIFVVLTSIYFSFSHNAQSKNNKIKRALINEFDSYKKLKNPKPSGLTILKSTENFLDAPIRITIFSDFQCPGCGHLALSLDKLISKYKGKANIQYYTYPLDNACHPQIKRRFHPFSCKAAYLAHCLKNNFKKVHDDFFHAQREISDVWLENYAKENKVLDCYKQETYKQAVVDGINYADKNFQINSTPTLIINGVKIEGALPPQQMTIILDELLNR